MFTSLILKYRILKIKNPNSQKTNWGLIYQLNQNYKVPLFACSLSMDSNNALKFPAPNPVAPIR